MSAAQSSVQGLDDHDLQAAEAELRVCQGAKAKVKGLDVDVEPELLVTLYQVDHRGEQVGERHQLTCKQLSISSLFFERDEKGNPTTPLKRLDEPIPIQMTWAMNVHTPAQAAYGLAKVVEWMKHYDGVVIPIAKTPLASTDLSQAWKDTPVSAEDKTPWCVKWINQIKDESKEFDRIYQVDLCANYFGIEPLLRLCCSCIAAAVKGKALEQVDAILGTHKLKQQVAPEAEATSSASQSP